MKTKKKILILFKSPWDWNKFIIYKLSKFYNVEHLYINAIQDKNFSEILSEINKKIDEDKIEIVFFEADYYKFVNLYFISKIKNVKKVLMTFDDYDLHEMNAITASACDVVITGCPLSLLKYKEKGYQAFWTFLENDNDVYKNYKEKKEFDVLFFGGLNNDRKIFLDYIEKKGIKVKIVGKQSNNFLKDEDLAKLICKSKIVLNLSKSTWGAVRTYAFFQLLYPDHIYKFFYQIKGRLFTAGLCGTACVSEFFPGYNLFFNENELEIFYTKEECFEILTNLLKNEELLEKYTNNFSTKVQNVCDDREFRPIINAIENLKYEKVKLLKVPYWYLRIAAKQIIIRNIKISSLKKSILQFNLIFSLIKNSSILTKLLILFESIINVFWYPIVKAIKTKKFQ